MTYVAVGEVYGGDVENMLQFCSLISRETKPYHAEFLEKELLKMVALWPVYLDWYEIYRLLERTYKKAVEKHFKLKSTGPLPKRIQFFTHQRLLRYRSYGTIITLDMAYALAALLLVQGYSVQSVERCASKANLSPVVRTSESEVLLPSEAINLQLSLGTVSNLLSK